MTLEEREALLREGYEIRERYVQPGLDVAEKERLRVRYEELRQALNRPPSSGMPRGTAAMLREVGKQIRALDKPASNSKRPETNAVDADSSSVSPSL